MSGVLLTAPIINGRVIEFPCNDISKYNRFCGPGDGFLEWLVSERIYGVLVSVACYIHDYMREIILETPDLCLEELMECFDQHNLVFKHNMDSLIEAHEFESDNDKAAALYRSVTYYTWVQVPPKERFIRTYIERHSSKEAA
jgi:hypothetical protein